MRKLRKRSRSRNINRAIFNICQMNIKPDVIYQSFTMTSRGNVDTQWTIHEPLSGDLVAGLVLGLYILIGEDNVEHFKFDYDFKTVIEVREGDEAPILIYNHNTVNNALEHYINTMDVDYPPEGYFGLLIRHSLDHDFYHLYTFQTAEFIQGFISMFASVGIDFREYLFGPPGRLENGVIIYYNIQGYDIQGYNLKGRRIPAPGTEQETDDEIEDQENQYSEDEYEWTYF